MANRNVVVRPVPVKPRVEARTTEIDCTPFAKLIEDQEPADLEAEIEVVAALPEVDAPARAARFAHTLPRDASPLATDDEPDER